MKKLINKPENLIEEMIEGYLCIDAGLWKLSDHKVVIRRNAGSERNNRVAVISGGGSGHEPAHVGYVGAGMLSAAVAGEVFTSPSADSVFAAIKAVAGQPGALLIIKNYTGDRLNFGVAAERARAEGILVESVIVADDVALAGVRDHAGSRGLAGTVFVHKIAGAAAWEGKSLPEVARVAEHAAGALATMGVCLSPGIIPAIGKPNFVLGDAEVELGLGIHGEPGVSRVPLQSADQMADTLLHSILSARPVAAGSRVAVLINNLGATPSMELAIVARRTTSVLRERGLIVERIYAGVFVSSLESAGISLSILELTDERLRLLDAPASAPAWPRTLCERPTPPEIRTVGSTKPRLAFETQGPPQSDTGKRIQHAAWAACAALINAERLLTEMDQVAGDGDLGISLARGANSIQQSLSDYPLDNPVETLKAIGLTLQDVLGGSSGPLYGVLFLRVANSLRVADANDPASWANALLDGCNAISEMGGANAGDRTMLDALIPFAETFSSAWDGGCSIVTALNSGAAAAEASAKATAMMMPKRGRSSYIGERVLGHPDPGAIAVAVWLRALVLSISNEDTSTPQ
jgi:triose/dihydroxyacetone kinase / FAD-AMP lyase (cyclizing)